MSYSPQGSYWHRWDLHFHTPSSFDYEGKGVSNENIVDCLLAAQIRAVAVTDHHKIDVGRIRELQRLAGDQITVLPGIELRDDHGGHPIHYICIFPEDCDLDHVWTTLQGQLKLTPAAIAAAGGDERIYVPIEDGAAATAKLGGIISIHAGSKSNSIENISNREQFQQRIKYDITSQYVSLFEIGQLKDIDVHLSTIFPGTGLDQPLLICSDNHDANRYETKVPLWFRTSPTFRGLLMVLREPRDRVYLGQRPPDDLRVAQNGTKYIRAISFERAVGAPGAAKWFGGRVTFNPGLVAIVGNKGSGKSALADTIGLLGSTKNSAYFSFLSKQRFLHPQCDFAKHFFGTLEWNSGECPRRCLSDGVTPEEVERVKHLPQDHVETVCNELAGIGKQGFDSELKAVIFSHVPEAQRLGQRSLDELVGFQTGEKQKRIDALIAQLRDHSRLRARLEAQATPVGRRALLETIERRKVELSTHDDQKPAPVVDPATVAPASTATSSLLGNVAAAKAEEDRLRSEISATQTTLLAAERRRAVADRLTEGLHNFDKYVDEFKLTLDEDAAELQLSVSDLLAVKVTTSAPAAISAAAVIEIAACKLRLDGTAPPGLRLQLDAAILKTTELQSQLDAPNRAYQQFLKELATWEEKRATLIGDESRPDTLKYLESSLLKLDALPAQIEDVGLKQLDLARLILQEKVSQATVFRTLYQPVQNFIDSHHLATGKLKLEFRAELVHEGFAERFLGILALNRKGSFMGVDDGRQRVEDELAIAIWENPDSVAAFLKSIDSSLHEDRRLSGKPRVELADQLSKGHSPEEVWDFLYGLEYVQPRYVLRWEGKDLSMLSPGERGTLLLVFYLLIDKSDLPLIIDQPEGNLDNHTVAQVLVDCIKEARKRRQVFIVTHNPNLAVVCDADQIVHAEMDKEAGNAVAYTSGALEDPKMIQFVTDVLEGTRRAFNIRGSKYQIGD